MYICSKYTYFVTAAAGKIGLFNYRHCTVVAPCTSLDGKKKNTRQQPSRVSATRRVRSSPEPDDASDRILFTQPFAARLETKIIKSFHDVRTV